jgi:hypothetical protein
VRRIPADTLASVRQLDIPLRGRIFLWSLLAPLVVVSFAELIVPRKQQVHYAHLEK